MNSDSATLRRSKMLILALVVGLLVAAGGLQVPSLTKAADGPGYAIDLTRASGGRQGVVLQSMVDPRWANIAIGPHEDVVEKRCGCLLAVF